MNSGSISFGTVYNAVTFNYNNVIHWTIQGPLSADSVAGICAALSIIMSDLNSNIAIIDIFSNHGKNLISLDVSNSNDVQVALNDYIIAYEIDISSIDQFYPNFDLYGWWIKRSSINNLYTLFTFRSAVFIQGFISIFSSFELDFRNFINGEPFKYDYRTKTITNYTIEGYDIEPFNKLERIPAPIGAYYVDRNEGDAYGEDFG